MAKINKVNKSRKEYTCSKCGKVIPKGSSYVYGAKFYGPTIYRHVECGIEYWELSGSEFVQTCGRIQSRWESEYDLNESTVDSIVADLEELRDTTQDSLDNMPEGLQQGDTGTMLEERVDMLQEVIDELGNVESYENLMGQLDEENMEDYREENDIDPDAELTEEQTEECNNLLEARVESELRDAINDALSSLEF